jgi:quinol monooxygenase YgiN
LGDGVRGPPITDIHANWRIAQEFFTKRAISYTEYKQQCISLRIFAFSGVTASCALALIVDPPKSSYWMRYSPTFWWSHVRNLFFSSSPPIFFASRLDSSAEVHEVVGNALFGATTKAEPKQRAAVHLPSQKELKKPESTGKQPVTDSGVARAKASPSAVFCINAKLVLKQEKRDEFLKVMEEDKARTAEEPLAITFVLGEDTKTPNTFYLHEQYKGSAGFEAHKKTSHFKQFEEFCGRDPFVEPLVIQTYELL